MLDELAGLCVSAGFDYRIRPEAHAPDGDLVFETAVNGAAEVIATFDIADLRGGAAPYGITVERPGDVLKRMV